MHVQLVNPNPGNRIYIASGYAENGNYLHLSNAFVDYIPYHYQISRITVYSSRNYTSVSEDAQNKNILTDMSVQPFTSWAQSPLGYEAHRAGLQSREFVVLSSTGTRVKASIIPSKRDRQFVFNGATNAGPTELETANDLVWITRETGVPVDYWTDTYVDFEIMRWGHYGPPTVWYKGFGTTCG